MAVRDGGSDLVEQKRGKRLRELPVLDNEVGELPARAVIHEEIGMIIIREEVVQIDQVGVPDERHRIDLALKAIPVARAITSHARISWVVLGTALTTAGGGLLNIGRMVITRWIAGQRSGQPSETVQNRLKVVQ
jgi:hypothetical protein